MLLGLVRILVSSGASGTKVIKQVKRGFETGQEVEGEFWREWTVGPVGR